MAYDFKILESKLVAAREWLGKEFKAFRTGRATPAILDSVQVSAYGSFQPLKHIATISVEDARTIRVQPFDPSTLKDIERAVAAANLGLGSVPDQTSLRLTFPDLTGERRIELTKIAKGKLEEARQTVRAMRDETWKDIQEKETEGIVSEDDKFRLKEEMQKKVNACNEELEKMFEKKETEMQA